MQETIRIMQAYRDGITLGASIAWPMLSAKRRTEYLGKLCQVTGLDPEVMRVAVDVTVYELSQEGNHDAEQ